MCVCVCGIHYFSSLFDTRLFIIKFSAFVRIIFLHKFFFSSYGVVSYCKMISDTFKCLHTIVTTVFYTSKTHYVHFSITRSVYGADDVHGFAVTVPIKTADGTVTYPAIKPYDDADSSGTNIPFILSSILCYFYIFLLIRQVLLYRIKLLSHF